MLNTTFGLRYRDMGTRAARQGPALVIGRVQMQSVRPLSSLANFNVVHYGVFRAGDGIPRTVRQTTTNLVLSAHRPDVIDTGNQSAKAAEPSYANAARRWLLSPSDPAFPFVNSSSLGFGNLGRNTTRMPGHKDLNLSMFRDFRITERARLPTSA